MRTLEEDQRATRAIYATCLAALFGFMGIGVVDPLLPVIAAQIGAAKWQIELLFTTYIFMMAIVMIPAGILAANRGNKGVMVVGLGLVTLFALFCGFSNSVYSLAGLRAGWGMGNAMFFATSMSIIIGLSSNLERSMGLYEAALGLGMSVGPLLGGVLGAANWRYPFFATSALMAIAFILTLSTVYEPPGGKSRKGFRDFGRAMAHPPFLGVSLVAMCYYFAFFTILAYSPIFLQIPALELGLIFFAWGLCLAYGSVFLAHKLLDRHGGAWTVKFGLSAIVAVLVLLIVVPSFWGRVAIIIVSGLFCGLNNTTFSTLAVEISNAQRSIASGAYNFVRWMGAAIAPVVAGVVAERWFPTAPYLIAGILVFVGLLGVWLTVGQHKTMTMPH
ncbi:MFS transporter [Kyrpidia spormannii]|uniref:MFS transporter n=1 Tax=Kyrpidia spormannii TaxID=2055160 RepID=A0A6F9EA82_9BACL|nr:MFS transporter [Kyrpidia spormannii]CAB3393788.1 MFS transporter [Kyrpidia spormannii]